MRFVTMVCSDSEFNALRDRLPRATRRTVAPVAVGDRGVIVQAIGADDVPRATVYACVRRHDDLRTIVERLKATIGEEL